MNSPTEDIVKCIFHTGIPGDLRKGQADGSKIRAEFLEEVERTKGTLFQTDAKQCDGIFACFAFVQG